MTRFASSSPTPWRPHWLILSGCGPRGALQGASWLVDQLADGITAAGKLRGRAAVALRDEENLSLAQLGERLGLSKARAADIVRDTREHLDSRQPEPNRPS